MVTVNDLEGAADSPAGGTLRRANSPSDNSAPRVPWQAAPEGHVPSGHAEIAIDLDGGQVLSDVGDRYPFSGEPHAPAPNTAEALVAIGQPDPSQVDVLRIRAFRLSRQAVRPPGQFREVGTRRHLCQSRRIKYLAPPLRISHTRHASPAPRAHTMSLVVVRPGLVLRLAEAVLHSPARARARYQLGKRDRARGPAVVAPGWHFVRGKQSACDKAAPYT
jgi:hypothetical protein